VLTTLNMLTAVLAVLAGLAWMRSTRVVEIFGGQFPTHPPGRLPKPAILYEIDAKGREVELIGTLTKQSKWNRHAATLAAAAAFSQALVSILSAMA
jgi:hypothetical protein